MEIIKLVATSGAIMLGVIAYVPYLVAILHGKNKPHLYTWISITLITFVVGIIQWRGGAGIGAWPTLISACLNLIILYFTFRFGTKDIVPLDKICLGVTLFGVVVYLTLQSQPVLALSVVTIAEITSFIPTFRKTRNDPFSESLPSYYLVMLKLVLIVVALETYNFETVSYSVLWLAVFTIFLAFVHGWRKHAHVHKAKPSDIVGI
ncbi:MAG TPA: hypothetical protein VGE34_02525 [Candidatus Saccharimonadales bacterium]